MKSLKAYDVQADKKNSVYSKKRSEKLKSNNVLPSKAIGGLQNTQHLSRKIRKRKSSFEVSEKNTINVFPNVKEILKPTIYCDTDLVPTTSLKRVHDGMNNSESSVSNAGLKLNCKKNSNKKRSLSDISEVSARKNKKVITNKKKMCNAGSTEDENSVQFTSDDYKPGMLSDLLQMKKYGLLILPWDPSFGLDPTYKLYRNKERNEQEQMLKINPLFDLSKRKNENSTSSNHMENTVFVGNLPYKTRNTDLKKIFRKFGKILHVKIRRKKFKKIQKKEKSVTESGKQINALVRFRNADSCKEALQMNGVLYEGHHLRVTLSTDEGISDTRKCVFLGNLAFGAKDDDVWKTFEDCGEIASVRVVRDERTGIGKGFGYINFKAADSVELALKLDGTTLLDRNVRIRRSHSDARSLSNSITVKKKRKKCKPRGAINTAQSKYKQEVIENDLFCISDKNEKYKKAVAKDQNTKISIDKLLKQKKRKKKFLEHQLAATTF